MHCWKSFNVDNKYLFYRRFFISTMITLLVFITLYVPLQSIASVPLQENYFITFLVAFILLYPIHKLCHLLPIINYYKFVKVKMNVYFYVLPIMNLKVKKPIQKYQFAIALLFPFFLINSILLLFALLMPQYVHYATILLAYHIGLSSDDLFYAKSLLFSPRDALVEENEQGYEILVE
ncbi:DUF3267 domain-containing protein [Lederbergia lenta]|uniref:Bacteriocin n=1 Tax=Lederbergia lenta TaxID=1467 RepID=A0A2X4Z9D9_LEDLE|nr:DUF3267 domain-containing protein [Lederbergia lenta]MCM3110518.1 DUF3267 domain-containing protein [Lederbergia lenta]MEC2323916.1 DUF3267 domain-containing protein [Lederbergia lenta]SQI61025.1 bacteriocin [Lederbergia lenta]